MSFLRRREIAAILAVTALFGGLAYLGISVSRENGRVAMLWMPNAIAAAWLLRARWASSGPLIASCALMNIAVNRYVGDSWLTAIGLSGANALEIALVVWIIRKQVQRRLDMSEISDQVWLLGASLIACFGSATVASFVLAGGEGAFAIRDWTKWALADGLSLLVLLPVLLVGVDIWGARKSFTRKFVTEWLVMIVVVATGSTIVFSQTSYPFLFLVTSLIIYSAFRTGLAGTAAALLVVTMVASIASAAGRGPISLVRGGIEAQFFAFQVFLAANLVMGLPVAAMLAGRARDRLELKKSRDASQHILDNIRDVIFSTDKGGRWSSLNPAWETITGYCSEQSLGTSVMELLHPDEIEETQALFQRIETGAVEESTFVRRFRNSEGQWRYVEVQIRRLADKDGSFAGTIGNISDVTENIVQKQDLAESEERFRKLAEAAPVGIFRADSKGQLTYINPNWAEKLGKSVEEMLGQGWLETVADREPYREAPPFHNFQPGEIRRRTIRFRAADGSDLWMETFNSGEFDLHGNLKAYFGAAVDVTEQVNAVRQLEESERRFQTLADLAPAGIFRTDADGLCTYVNPAWARQTGMSDGQWLGDGWVTAMHPGDRDWVAQAWRKAVEAQEAFREEFRWLRPDGTVVWVDTIGRPEIDDTGTILGFIGVNLDVSDRRAALEKLAERDEQLSLITDNVKDAVVRLTPSGDCLYASPSSQDIFELDPRAMVGVNLITGFHPDDDQEVRQVFADLASGHRDRALIAFRSAAPNDPERYRWMEANCAVVHDAASGEPKEIIASIRNVSQAKALEEDLRNARRRAEDAAVAKSAFLANMSHEIRTPMNGVIGFTELLERSELDSTQHQYVQMIADSGRGMMRLLNDILDISKIEAGLMQISLEPLDLHHKVKDVVRLMEPIARKNSVEVQLEIAEDVPRWVLGDAVRIRQALLNLVGNAVKFTERGSIDISVSVVDDGRSLAINVVDTGVGIAEENLKSIFDQFTQADSSVARRFGGSGLGLAITKQLVELMGGHIAAESEVGRGSTFSVLLPLVVADELVPAESVSSADVKPPAAHSQSVRLLIAEDNDINQTLIRAMAKEAGFEPTIVTDGQAAIVEIEQSAKEGNPYSLVFMDLQMPGMDGLSAARKLREMGYGPEDLPIVALTGNAFAEDIAACRAAGMQMHIAKPIRTRDLIDAVELFGRGSLNAADEPVTESQDPELLERYRQKKNELAKIAHSTTEGNCASQIETILNELHQIAGIAAVFGEETTGKSASKLERELRQTIDPAARMSLVSQIPEILAEN